MITEDYVNFEIAELLKEKGFDEECIGYYVDYEPNDIKYSFCGETNSIWESRCCSAPTLQMAMKWLREVHHLHITIKIYTVPNGIVYAYEIDKLGHTASALKLKSGFDSFKEACEAAIKYCLTNLI